MKKRNLFKVFSAVLCFLLCACASGSSSNSSYAIADTTAAGASSKAANEAEWDIVYTEDSSFEEETSSELSSEKLVYTGSLSIETLNYSDTLRSIRERIAFYNGIIESESEYDSEYDWYSSSVKDSGTKSMWMTVRIPTEYFDTFMSDLEGTGKVLSRSSSVENITKRYNSTAIETESLETQRKRLLEMMESAETVEDMITVESRLSEVEKDLKQAENSMNQMDTDVAYSTISIDVEEVVAYTAADPGSKISNFFERAGEAWGNTWINFVYVMQILALALIALLPFLILIAVIVLLVRFIAGRHKKNKNISASAVESDEKK